MLRAKAFSSILTATLLLAACGQLIGLGDYEAVEGDAESGSSGKGGKGGGAGSGGSSGKGGAGGEAGTDVNPGTGGTNDAGSSGIGGDGTGGTTGGSSGNAGAGGTGDTGGAAGDGAAGAGDGGLPGVGGSAGAGGVGGEGGSGGEVPRVCGEVTLGAIIVSDQAEAPSSVQYFTEFTPAIGEDDGDFAAIDFYQGSGYDGAQRGTFNLGEPEEAQYQTCARCVRIFQDLGGQNEKVFFQESGEMFVDPSSDQMNGSPVFTISDVTLIEVTIDAEYLSEPVPNGECLHVTAGSFSITAGEPLWDDVLCNINWRGDGLCDCGCGLLDPDCSASTADVCDGCYCAGDTDVCSANANWLCEPAPTP
jgi:hypothetical protein